MIASLTARKNTERSDTIVALFQRTRNVEKELVNRRWSIHSCPTVWPSGAVLRIPARVCTVYNRLVPHAEEHVIIYHIINKEEVTTLISKLDIDEQNSTNEVFWGDEHHTCFLYHAAT
jgi:hypothetical protein